MRKTYILQSRRRCFKYHLLKLANIKESWQKLLFLPYYSVGQGKNLHGVQVYLRDFDKARLSDIQFHVMEVAAQLYPDKKVFDRADESRFGMFDRVCGTDFIRKEFSKNHRFADIQSYWTKDEESFRKQAKKYYLYR